MYYPTLHSVVILMSSKNVDLTQDWNNLFLQYSTATCLEINELVKFKACYTIEQTGYKF